MEEDEADQERRRSRQSIRTQYFPVTTVGLHRLTTERDINV